MIPLLHRWIWHDAERRARKLLAFAETEADGGRDLLRAAELTQDPTLRRLYMIHAADEQRHAELFRWRGATLLRSLPKRSSPVLQLNRHSPYRRSIQPSVGYRSPKRWLPNSAKVPFPITRSAQVMGRRPRCPGLRALSAILDACLPSISVDDVRKTLLNISLVFFAEGHRSSPGCAGTDRAARQPRPSGRSCSVRG